MTDELEVLYGESGIPDHQTGLGLHLAAFGAFSLAVSLTARDFSLLTPALNRMESPLRTLAERWDEDWSQGRRSLPIQVPPPHPDVPNMRGDLMTIFMCQYPDAVAESLLFEKRTGSWSDFILCLNANNKLYEWIFKPENRHETHAMRGPFNVAMTYFSPLWGEYENLAV